MDDSAATVGNQQVAHDLVDNLSVIRGGIEEGAELLTEGGGGIHSDVVLGLLGSGLLGRGLSSGLLGGRGLGSGGLGSGLLGLGLLLGGRGVLTAGSQGEDHAQGQEQCENLFHCFSSYLFFIKRNS